MALLALGIGLAACSRASSCDAPSASRPAAPLDAAAAREVWQPDRCSPEALSALGEEAAGDSLDLVFYTSLERQFAYHVRISPGDAATAAGADCGNSTTRTTARRTAGPCITAIPDGPGAADNGIPHVLGATLRPEAPSSVI